jgi:hypothetical protein
MSKDTTLLKPAAVAALKRHVRGGLLLPSDGPYALKRRIWNANIDRNPCAIAECADAQDVTQVLRIASDHGLAVTVRGGGHNSAGRSVADNVLLLDLSRMRAVKVQAASRSAAVEGGALWHDVDVAAARSGLGTTGGMVSSTGVGGFTLGGGAGWLMRKFGLAVDNLEAASVVLADGRFIRASVEEHPDLFWGLRGGAGRLGVVTNFDFKLYPVNQVFAGLVVRPANEARQALRAFRDYAAEAPDEFCGMTVLAHAPPLPFLHASWHGRPVVISALFWCGDIAAAESALAPLRRFGAPLTDHVGPMPYLQWQHLQDAGAPPGRHQYWKTASYRALPDAVIDALADALEHLPSASSEMHVQHLGGAVSRVAAADTAFSQRDTGFFVNLIGVTAWPEEHAMMRERIRELHSRISPGSLSQLLPNFSNQDDGDIAGQLMAETGQRLQELRRRYDPSARFAAVDAKLKQVGSE